MYTHTFLENYLKYVLTCNNDKFKEYTLKDFPSFFWDFKLVV